MHWLLMHWLLISFYGLAADGIGCIGGGFRCARFARKQLLPLDSRVLHGSCRAVQRPGSTGALPAVLRSTCFYAGRAVPC
jgi:hypothetical protein